MKMVARIILSVSTGAFPRPNESPSFTSITFAPRWFSLLRLGAFLNFIGSYADGGAELRDREIKTKAAKLSVRLEKRLSYLPA
jgi:hypothetical protein